MNAKSKNSNSSSDLFGSIEKYIQEGINITLFKPDSIFSTKNKYKIWKFKVAKLLSEYNFLNESDIFCEADAVTNQEENDSALESLSGGSSLLANKIREETLRKLLILREVRSRVETLTRKNNPLRLIVYNSKTGRGTIAGKSFSFYKTHKGVGKAFRLFALLYEKINISINRYDVLEAIGIYEDGEAIDIDRATLESREITNIVSKIRERTGLTTKELIVNNGDVTLIGRKM